MQDGIYRLFFFVYDDGGVKEKRVLGDFEIEGDTLSHVDDVSSYLDRLLPEGKIDERLARRLYSYANSGYYDIKRIG